MYIKLDTRYIEVDIYISIYLQSSVVGDKDVLSIKLNIFLIKNNFSTCKNNIEERNYKNLMLRILTY